MGRSTRWRALVVVLLVMGAAPDARGQDQRSHVSIQLSNQGAVPEWALAQAQEVVARIYAHSAVKVVWSEESTTHDDLPVTVILAGPAPLKAIKNPAALAAALTSDTGCGRLVYVLWPRIEAFARAQRVQVAKVLGRVIAHEVGHLLLGHNAHSEAGIMRADWNGAEFDSVDKFAVFSRLESAHIHARLASPASVARCR